MARKVVIYQLLPRLFSKREGHNIAYGSKQTNGCGTLDDIDTYALEAISRLGATHIWLTGIIAHASCEHYEIPGHQADHPAIVKGRAGSPYAIRDYYDIHPDLAKDPLERMAAFEQLIERCRAKGMGIIIDHVPNHVARNYRGTLTPFPDQILGATDNPHLAFDASNDYYYIPGQKLVLPGEAYEQAMKQAPDHAPGEFEEYPARATGNDRFTAQPHYHDWYETLKLNYGQPPVADQPGVARTMLWKKMLDILLFWASKGIAGFRCDMAGMVPLAYWQWAIQEVRSRFPGIYFIAELYEPERYTSFLEAGFDYLYDKVGFYDTCIHILKKEKPAAALTSCWQASQGIGPQLLRFIENHDEQRIASRFLCDRFEPGIPAYAAAALMHQGPCMIYAGQELGVKGDEAEGFSQVDGRTSIFDYWCIPEFVAWRGSGRYDGNELPPARQALLAWYQRLGNCLMNHPALSTGEFFDLQYMQSPERYDQERLFSFLRYDSQSVYIVLLNFDATARSASLKITEHAFEFLPMSLNSSLTVEMLPDFPCKELEIQAVSMDYISIRLALEPHTVSILLMEGDDK